MSAVGKAFVEVYDVVIAGPVLSQFTQSVHLVIDETDLDQGCPNPGLQGQNPSVFSILPGRKWLSQGKWKELSTHPIRKQGWNVALEPRFRQAQCYCITDCSPPMQPDPSKSFRSSSF